MKKVTTIELFENGVSLGYAPLIGRKGEKSVMIFDMGKPITFKTKK